MTDIPLSQPDVNESEIRAVTNVLRSNRLSIGPRQDLFEQTLADRVGRRHGIAVSSGTAGLHLALLALDIGPGDEVITTPFSFIASANPILMVGATPRFVDICPTSLNLDPQRLEEAFTARTKAVIGVEVFGNPTHMEKIEAICRKHEVPMIEDSCEGLGGTHQGRAVGGFGRISVFGFYPNKQITTGEGGMIVTDDDRLSELCQSMRNQGRPVFTETDESGQAQKAGSWLTHERMGYNYRLSELAAAMGVAQMDRLDAMLEQRRFVAGQYMRRLMSVEDLVLPNVPEDGQQHMSWFVFVVRLAHGYTYAERDRIVAGMRRHGIGAASYFPCIHLQPPYHEVYGFGEGQFPVAESISQRTVALPFYNQLDEPNIDLVCHTLGLMIQREQLHDR